MKRARTLQQQFDASAEERAFAEGFIDRPNEIDRTELVLDIAAAVIRGGPETMNRAMALLDARRSRTIPPSAGDLVVAGMAEASQDERELIAGFQLAKHRT